MTTLLAFFTDSVTWDDQEKSAVSVRDGVVEYLGSEIGQEPADKLFTVYRSPATIAKINELMPGVPLTNDHVSLDTEVTNPVGSVLSSEIIDFIDSDTVAHLALRNRIKISDSISGALRTGKRQLSLGYFGKLVPHDRCDFEQIDLLPHHLAVVLAGRCGSACSFIDKMPEGVNTMFKKRKTVEGLHKAFMDAEGQPNLQQIVEIAQQLPEALKAVPMDKLQEIMPVLQEIIALTGVTAPAADTPEGVTDEEPEKLKDEEIKKEELVDEAPEIPITDSAEFKDAVSAALKRHTETIEKARGFLDESYSFTGKSTAQIMRDAVAVEHGKQQFTDHELTVAFKLLKKSGSDLRKFGDASAFAGKFSSLADKEL